MGPVRSGCDNCTYDDRLLAISSPFFINPVSSSFVVVSWAALRTPDGLSALD